MEHLLSLMAVAVLTLLPGAVLTGWRSIDDRLEALGRCCAISLAVNCFAIMGLFVSGHYRTTTAWIWLILVALGSILILRFKRHGEGPEEQTSDQRMREVTLWGLPAILLIALFPILYKSFFLHFFSWDAVSSWNRWARDFVLMPELSAHYSLFYTQFNSFGMSFPYMIGGDTDLEYYAHSLSFIHALILYAGLRALGSRLGFSAVTVMLALLLTLPFYKWTGTGYADVAAAAYLIWAIALFFTALDERRRSLAWWSGLAGATAYLFKQSTLPILVAVPLLAVAFAPAGDRMRRLGLGSRVAAGLSMAPICWNLIGGHPLFDNQFRHVMSGIHGSLSQWEVLQRAALEIIESITFFRPFYLDALAAVLIGVLILVGAAQNRFVGILSLAGLLHLLVWANTASYNARGAMPAFAVLAIAGVVGLKGLAQRLPANRTRVALIGSQAALLLALAYAEAVPVFAGKPLSKVDWRPGFHLSRTRPWLTGRENLARLDPSVKALEQWRKAHPGFKGRLWSSPFLISLVHRKDFSRSWMDIVDRGGLAWREGDFVFISTDDLRRPKRNHMLLFPEVGKMTWKEWLESMVERGDLSQDSAHGRYRSYRVLRDPPVGPSAGGQETLK